MWYIFCGFRWRDAGGTPIETVGTTETTMARPKPTTTTSSRWNGEHDLMVSCSLSLTLFRSGFCFYHWNWHLMESHSQFNCKNCFIVYFLRSWFFFLYFFCAFYFSYVLLSFCWFFFALCVFYRYFVTVQKPVICFWKMYNFSSKRFLNKNMVTMMLEYFKIRYLITF